MSSENSDSRNGFALSAVAQFDDTNRLNGVLNDGVGEECKHFLYIGKKCVAHMFF